MDVHQNNDSLNEIVTPWPLLFEAHQEHGEKATIARRRLLVRYHQAVYRYLLSRLADSHAAAQLASDFAVRVLEADEFLRRARPGFSSGPKPGRFRFYLKKVLWRMVVDYYRRQQRDRKARPEPLPQGDQEPADPRRADHGRAGRDMRFRDCWRQELLNKAWQALADVERQTGQPYCTVVRLRQEHPALRSGQIAERLGSLLGRKLSAPNVRQIFHRGRELFGELLVREVALSLGKPPGEEPDPGEVEEELIGLGLLFSFCKAALERQAAGHTGPLSR